MGGFKFFPGVLALFEQIAKVEGGGILGDGLEDFEGEGLLAVLVPSGLQIVVAVEMLTELEVLAVLGGGQVGRDFYPGAAGGEAAESIDSGCGLALFELAGGFSSF